MDALIEFLFADYAWYIIVAVIFTGVIVGFVNTLAGSGSLLSIPLLMALGLPANVANGTNRIPILLQCAVSVSSFKQQKVFEWREALWLTIPAFAGSIIGSLSAVKLTNRAMTITIGILLLVMFFLLVFKPQLWLKEHAGEAKAKPGIWQLIIFFGIGLYGGFIQAGVGFFLLAGLVLGAGHDLVKSNALKMVIVLFYTPIVLGIFIYNDLVDFRLGLIMALGNMSGAFVASRLAVKWGPKVVHWILMVVLVLASIKLLGLFDYLLELTGCDA